MKKKNYLMLLLAFLTATSSALATAPVTDPDKTDADNKENIRLAPKPSLAVNSYTYNTAIGVRAIGTSGITIKHFRSSNKALEGIIGFGPGALSATLLFETYLNAFDEPGLNWYYGIGGHIATQSDWVYYDGIRRYNRSSGDVGIGVDGIFGMEYKINEVPIAVSLDVKPFLEVTTGGNVYLAIDPGLGIKFAF